MRNKTALVMAVLVIVALAVMWTSGAVLAQRGGRAPGGPGGPGGGMQPPPGPHVGMLKAGANGVFVLAGPTLIKYSADLADQEALQLVEPPTDADTTQKPPLHGALLIAPATEGSVEKALIVIGDKFFAVDAATLEISAQGTLPALEAPADRGAQKPMGPPPGPGGLEYRDGKLYVQRGPTIVALSIADGSVIGQAELPKPEAP